MAYKERQLTFAELHVATAIHTFVPPRERLEVSQAVADIAENIRENAWPVKQKIWEAMMFPRYRFFTVATGESMWEQFAESRDAVASESLP